MKMIKSVFFVLFVLLFFAGCASQPSPVIYSVQLVVGDVMVLSDGAPEWVFPAISSPLYELDIVKTGADSYCDILMPDRGNFRIYHDTEIELIELRENSEDINLNSGRIEIDVTEPLQEAETFRVETSAAVVAIRGTQFIVEADAEDNTFVAVNHGRVAGRFNADLSETDDEVLIQAFESALEIIIIDNQGIQFNADDKQEMDIFIDELIEAGVSPDEVADLIKQKLESMGVFPVKLSDNLVSTTYFNANIHEDSFDEIEESSAERNISQNQFGNNNSKVDDIQAETDEANSDVIEPSVSDETETSVQSESLQTQPEITEAVEYSSLSELFQDETVILEKADPVDEIMAEEITQSDIDEAEIEVESILEASSETENTVESNPEASVEPENEETVNSTSISEGTPDNETAQNQEQNQEETFTPVDMRELGVDRRD